MSWLVSHAGVAQVAAPPVVPVLAIGDHGDVVQAAAVFLLVIAGITVASMWSATTRSRHLPSGWRLAVIVSNGVMAPLVAVPVLLFILNVVADIDMALNPRPPVAFPAPQPGVRGDRPLGNDGPSGPVVCVRREVVPNALPDQIEESWSTWWGPHGVRGIRTEDIVSWRDCPPWPEGPVVLLADGGVVAGRIVACDDGVVSIENPLLGRLALPPARVAGFRDGVKLGLGPLAPDGGPPRVVLADGHGMEATVIDWRPEGVRLDTPAGGVTAPPDDIRAIDFPPRDYRPQAALRLLVALRDGSRLAIHGLRSGGGPRRLGLWLDEVGGPVVRAVDRDAVVAIAVDGQAARLLAAMPPEEVVREAAIGPAIPLAVGRSATGGWPSLAGVTGFTALGLPAGAAVRYRTRVNEGRFSATVGIDDATGGTGEAVVLVRARAGQADWRTVAGPETVRGGAAPLTIAGELETIEEIELVVQATADGREHARTLWIDPRIHASR